MASNLPGSRKFDIPGSKKFEVPVELHRVLGNQFAVDQHEKKERRRKKKLEARAEAKRQQAVPSVNEYFNSAAMHKQVELELELERMRVSMRQPPPANPESNARDPTNNVTETPSRGSTSTPSGHHHQQVQYYNSDTPNDPAHLTAENTDEAGLNPAPPAAKKVSSHHHHGRHRKPKPTKAESEAITEESQTRTDSIDGEHLLEVVPQYDNNPIAPVAPAPRAEVEPNPVAPSQPVAQPVSQLASHPASQQTTRAESAVSYTTDSPALNATYPTQPYGGIPYPAPSSHMTEGPQPQAAFPDITRVGFGLAMPANSQQYLQHQYGQPDNHVHINQMYSPLTGTSGGNAVFPYTQTQPQYNQVYQTPQGYYPATQVAQSQNSGPMNNMFVLSSAPKMSYEQMVAQDIKDFYTARQFNAAAQSAHSTQPSAPSQPQSALRSGLYSSGSQLEHSPVQDRNAPYGFNPHRSAMQDQIYRYAEIRSLFEMPTADQPLMSSQFSPRGMNTEDPSTQAKLNDSIDRHRHRLMKSRQSQPNKAKANLSSSSPRGKVHRVHNPATSAQYQSHSHQQQRQQLPPQQQYQGNSSVSGSHHPPQQYSPSAPLSPMDGTRGRMSSMDGLSLFGSTYSDNLPQHDAHHREHKAHAGAGSHTNVHGQQPPQGHHHHHPESSASNLLSQPTPFVTTKELSALLDVPQLHLDASMTEFGQSMHSANNSVVGSAAPKVTVEMSLEQFELATQKLNDQLRSTVAAVVHEELLKDAQAQHYTQRMQKATLAKSTQPLSKKIEEKVEEKLAELKKELEELRAVKLASPPKPVVPAVEEEEEENSDMEGGEFEENAGNPDSWFLKNELGGRANKTAKSSPKTNKHKSSPNQRHGHAISKLEAELDLDFTAISQDIKKSVEYVMKKHMHNYPSPQRTTGTAGAVEGFALNAGAQPAPVLVESPRKEDVVSVPVPASTETASAAATKKSKHKKGKAKDGSALGDTSSSAPVPALAREPSFTKNVMNSLGGLFRANSTSSNPASSSSTAASVTKNVTAAAPAPRGAPSAAAPSNARNAQRPPRPALNAISDTEEDGYMDNNNNDDQTDDNSVSAMLREREQWERDITQAEIVFDTTARNLAALTDAKISLKKELKDWQRDFEVRVGRPATDADKSAIEDRFLSYQKVTRDVKEAGRRHKDAEIALRALKEKE